MKPIKWESKMWALACSDCAYSCMSDLQVYLAKQGNSQLTIKDLFAQTV